MQQSIDYGTHKGAQPKIVTKRAVVADLESDDAQAHNALAAVAPRRDASPIAWARFLHDTVPAFERRGWRIEIDPSVNELIVDASTPHAIWDARLASRESTSGGRLIGEAGEWFDVDLGVEVDGQRIALLPVIVDVLRNMDAGVVPQGDVTYAMSGDRAVVLPMERIRSVLQTLVELHDDPHLNARGKLALSRLSALELAQSIPDLRSEDESARAVSALAVHLAHGDGVAELPVPEGLHATLRAYQHEGYRWLQFLLAHNVGGILADDMGLGKSIQAIAHLLHEHSRTRHGEPVEPHSSSTRPSLLVVPTSLVPNWLAEIERFAPSLRVLTLHGGKRFQHYASVEDADLAITTYALLTRDEFFLHQPWHIAILDEAQAIKNANSKVARAAAKLHAVQRLCLTGTPMENHLGELWSLLNFVMPHALYDQRRFARVFRTPIEKENSEPRREQLARRIRPFILRRTKADVALQLPEKTEIVERIELAEDQRDLYESVRLAVHEEVRREIERLGLARSRIAVLDALLKLRQVCCDPRLVKLESAARVHSSAKLTWLVETLEQLADEGRRTLVFSQFTSMIDLMKRELDRANIRYVELVGSTTDRATPVRQFQSGEVPVFLISLRAGGTGLNLTAADTVIHFDPWWNPAVERQATDRAHRIGQDKPVFVYKLIAAGTVEEKILDLQAQKAQIASSLFEATDATSIDLRPEDIEALLS
jgi:SNF2 family DNA or RNA helicase